MDLHNKLKDSSKSEQIILGLAIESWRFSKTFERVLLKLDAGEQGRFLSQFRWHRKKIEDLLAEAGYHVANVEGQPYDPGMAATPLNLDEFKVEDILIVDQMLEPIIMCPDGLAHSGTVTVRRTNP